MSLWWLLGLHILGVSAPLSRAPSCPLHFRIALKKPTFTYWEIATGAVSVSNHDHKAISAVIIVTLFRDGNPFYKREVSLEIQPGRKTYDLTATLGFLPLIPPRESLVGEWRLYIESRSPGCIVSSEATFKVTRAVGRRVVAWKGLVGYWPFNDARGDRAADWSGRGSDAEVLGAGWADGKFHTALVFNGHSTMAKLPGVQAPGPDGMTFLFWIWPEEAGFPFQTVLSRPMASGDSAKAGWALLLHEGKLLLQTWVSDRVSRQELLAEPRRLLTRAWSHVALTYRGHTLALYLNGRFAGSLSTPLPDVRGANVFVGRGDPARTTAWFRGRIDELRIFNRVLGPDEIQADYGAAMPTPVEVILDPATRVGTINPLIYGVNVEGSDPFHLPKGLGITNVRWPGGCFAEGYHWRNAVGPTQGRRVRAAAACEGDQMSTSPARTDVGPDEFMALVREVGAVPHLTVNFATGTAQEAANWVEYMNGSSPGLAEGLRQGWTPSSYRGSDKALRGYFAWLRHYLGHPEPYGVKYWAVGNEFEARSAPSWTRNVKQYYQGGLGRSIRHWMTRDPTRTDWSLEHRISTGEPSAAFFAPFVPALPRSQRVQVLPVLRRDPLELGPPETWTLVPNIKQSGRGNFYEFFPAEAKIIFGDGVHGNVLPRGSLVRITYDSGPHDGFIEFARRMKVVDPSILVGTSAAFSEIPPEAATYVDFVAANFYSSLPINDPDPLRRYYRIQAIPVVDVEPYIHATQDYFRRNYPTKGIQLALTEFNHNLFSPHLRSVASGVFVADMLRVLARNRVAMANYYALHHLISSDSGGGQETPPGSIFRLYRTHFGTNLIATTVTAVPSFEGGFDGRKVRVPYLEVLATTDDAEQNTYLMIINKHAEHSFPVSIRVASEPRRMGGRLFQLGGDHPFEDVAALTTTAIEAPAGIVRLTVPPHSVTAIEISPSH